MLCNGLPILTIYSISPEFANPIKLLGRAVRKNRPDKRGDIAKGGALLASRQQSHTSKVEQKKRKRDERMSRSMYHTLFRQV